MIVRIIIASLLAIICNSFMQGQDQNSTVSWLGNVEQDEKKDPTTENGDPAKKEGKVVILPALGSSPANGFFIGAVATKNWRLSIDDSTSISSVTATLTYTTKKQLLMTCKGTLFFPKNKAVIMQDMRYFQTSQPTYGLGTGPSTAKLASNGFEYEAGKFSEGIANEQMLKFNLFRLYETYLRRIGKSTSYAGVGVHLDVHSKIKDQLLDLQANPPIITNHYAYSYKYDINTQKYTTVGISANYLNDTRDNTVSPYRGMYVFSTLRYNPTWLGSSKSSGSLWAEYRTYFNVNKSRPRNVIGVWLYGNFQFSGNLPYLDLPALGWDQFGRSGRGYPQGRFRGESVAYSEVEWRFPLQKVKDKWGAVVFLNLTTASNAEAKISMFEYINKGYGVGLRYMLDEKSRTNLCIDFGFGDYGSKGFYMGINEVF